MATVAQIVANQANAQLSTGPKSAEGKARVAQNAIRHGLTAKNLIVREDEREEFAALQADLLAEIDPQGVVETITFNEFLHAAWNLQRFRSMEARFSHGLRDLADPEGAATLDRLSRYQARTQRAYYRALQELRTLQTNRALREAKLAEETARKVPVLGDIRKLTKQTQSAALPRVIQPATRAAEPKSEAVAPDFCVKGAPETVSPALS